MPAYGQARKARLGIPRVQGPQQLDQGAPQPYGMRRSLALKTAQSSNVVAVPQTQSQPTEPLKTTPTGPPAPTAPKFNLPNYTGGGEDPRDASYWANVSKLKFSAEQDYAKVLREQQSADTGYNDALQTAIRNRATQQRGLGESALRSNLSASGWLDRNEAEDTTAYTQERAFAQLSKTEEDAARAATRSAIQQGFTLDAAAELGEAAARLAARKQQEAERAEARAMSAAASGGGEEGGGGPIWSGQAPKGGHIRPRKNPTQEAISKRRKAR